MIIEAKFKRGFQKYILKLISIPLEKYALGKIENKVVCSNLMKNSIGGYSNSIINIIPNGIDHEDIYNNNNNNNKQIESYHPNILFMGILNRIKGVDILLKAIPNIIRSIPNIQFYIVGSGPYETELKNIVNKLYIENYVQFLGYISGNERYKYLKSADVVVIPSRYDHFPILLLEAMACGKSIIASNVGGIPEILDNYKTGILFESENVEELAEKIILLTQNKDLKEKLGLAAKIKSEEYNWQKIANMTEELYKNDI
jgi:glycosyltransferase involved in cell wall biosynthesis